MTTILKKIFIFHNENINKLLVFHIISHITIIPMFFYASLTEWLLSITIFQIWIIIGASSTFHRLLSHKSYECSKFWEYLGTTFCTLGAVGSSITWTAIHRQHHRYTDKEQDPHSPLHKGILQVQFLIMLSKPNIKYVPDLLRNRFHVFMHNYYWAIHLLYIIILYQFDPFSIVYAYLIPALLLLHAGGLINTLGHKCGYKNQKINDSSCNNLLTGYLVGGEGWHNNHHADPKNYKFGQKWWEIDFSYFYIQLIRKK